MPKHLKNVLEKGNFGNSKEPQGHPGHHIGQGIQEWTK